MTAGTLAFVLRGLGTHGRSSGGGGHVLFGCSGGGENQSGSRSKATRTVKSFLQQLN